MASSASDYREMAQEFLRAADATDDPEPRAALLSMAKLYMQTALSMDVAALSSKTVDEFSH